MPSERGSGRIVTDGTAVPIGRRAVVLLLGLALAGCAAAARPSSGLPHVVVETSAGPIELEIDSVRAPVTAANFLHWVDARGYDGGSFYRAVTPANDRGTPIIEVVQGGRGLALENAVAGIAHEPTSVTGLRHRAGTISMSRDGPRNGNDRILHLRRRCPGARCWRWPREGRPGVCGVRACGTRHGRRRAHSTLECRRRGAFPLCARADACPANRDPHHSSRPYRLARACHFGA